VERRVWDGECGAARVERRWFDLVLVRRKARWRRKAASTKKGNCGVRDWSRVVFAVWVTRLFRGGFRVWGIVVGWVGVGLNPQP
jgi:hypothetical protein